MTMKNFLPTFTESVPYDGPIMVGVAGGTGSGKTLSALKLAFGLKGDDSRVAVIDTEHRRALLYTPPYRFLHMDFEPPFHPDHYVEAARAAAELVGNEGVVVIDSATHEWIGEGGVQDMAEERLSAMVARAQERNPGGWVNPDTFTPMAWGEPKRLHKRFVHEMTRIGSHLILSYRAENKVEFREEMDSKGRKKLKIEEAGPQLITGRREDPAYECLAFMMFDKSQPGRPRFTHKPLLQKLHGLFGQLDKEGYGDCIEVVHGRALRYWREGNPVDEALARAVEDRDRAKANSKAPKLSKKSTPAEDGPADGAREVNDVPTSPVIALRLPGEKKPQTFERPSDAGWAAVDWAKDRRTEEQIKALLELNAKLLEQVPGALQEIRKMVP
jgi:hypothetical protein